MSPNRIRWSELDVGAGGGMLPNAAKPEPWTGYDAQLEAVAVRGTKVWKPRPPQGRPGGTTSISENKILES